MLSWRSPWILSQWVMIHSVNHWCIQWDKALNGTQTIPCRYHLLETEYWPAQDTWIPLRLLGREKLGGSFQEALVDSWDSESLWHLRTSSDGRSVVAGDMSWTALIGHWLPEPEDSKMLWDQCNRASDFSLVMTRENWHHVDCWKKSESAEGSKK